MVRKNGETSLKVKIQDKKISLAGKDEIAKAYGVKKIYISCDTAYVIDAEDNLWAWGDNQYNKLGQGNSYLVATPIKIFENAKNVWAGALNTYVLDTNNQLWAAGANTHGQLGQGNTNIYDNFTKVNVNGLDLNTINIVKIEASNYTLAGNAIMICDNGKVYTYAKGNFASNVTGLNRTTSDYEEITVKEAETAKEIETQDGSSLVLLSNGEVYGIGQNDYGQLGTGNNIGASNFVRCEELEK